MAERRSPTASRRVTPIGERPATSRARGDGGTVIAVYGSRADVGVAAVATALALAFRSLGMGDVGLAELDPRLASRTRAGVIRSSANTENGGEHGSDAPDAIAISGTDAALVKRKDGVWTLAMPRERATAISDAKSVIGILRWRRSMVR